MTAAKRTGSKGPGFIRSGSVARILRDQPVRADLRVRNREQHLVRLPGTARRRIGCTRAGIGRDTIVHDVEPTALALQVEPVLELPIQLVAALEPHGVAE